jgi:hypothetical protein
MSTTIVTERYEGLRAAVLAHDLASDRRGLALMRREGLAAWAAAWTSCSPTPPARPESDRVGALAERSALVTVLASMALSSVEEATT